MRHLGRTARRPVRAPRQGCGWCSGDVPPFEAHHERAGGRAPSLEGERRARPGRPQQKHVVGVRHSGVGAVSGRLPDRAVVEGGQLDAARGSSPLLLFSTMAASAVAFVAAQTCRRPHATACRRQPGQQLPPRPEALRGLKVRVTRRGRQIATVAVARKLFGRSFHVLAPDWLRRFPVGVMGRCRTRPMAAAASTLPVRIGRALRRPSGPIRDPVDPWPHG